MNTSDFSILLIDDEPAQITSIKAFLKRRNFTVYSALSGEAGLDIVRTKHIDLVFSDFRMPDLSGKEVLSSIKKINPNIPVVIITAFSDTKDAVAVMKDGAYDYLSKPVDLDELELLIKRVQEWTYLKSENELLKEQLQEKYKFNTIISQSKEMEEVINTAGRVANSKATVLIRGESGTGKELIAKVVHQASPRNHKPLITVNCAALSESLLESELFGHEKGSFTGASAQRIGRFEQADGATLFIDEIGDISPQTQVKLLRVLQFGEFERVGGSKTIKVDVRVITATNRNLEELIQQGIFREDLFYRINVVTILLPPLRDRKTDIPLLVDHFIKKYAEENARKMEGISKEGLDTLMQYPFPGNIRELENIIERAVIMARGSTITTTDLPKTMYDMTERETFNPYDFSMNFSDKVAGFEEEMIKKALELKAGNQSQAAKILGITERHLRSKMQKLGIINDKRP
ncbi:MAG: sigma-54 dependent transcriptional regulator [Bacteroidales bacterium]|nr:sigma-54 dependent transcriptional regulator [Bacteroidales bacterium]MCF8458294.1 sigma-54 dependent transcriptional regulator [Bacteroidales bacterium]